jgi:hypothetical protein
MTHSATTRRARRARNILALIGALTVTVAVSAPAASAASPDGDPFYTTPELCKLTLEPTTVDVLVGGTQTLTAKLESTGVHPPPDDRGTEYGIPCLDERVSVPVSTGDEPDYGVQFNLLSGPNSPAGAFSVYDSNWTATHTYSSQLAGTDNWEATTEIPAVCVVDWYEYDGFQWQGPVPAECEGINDECYYQYCEGSVINPTSSGMATLTSNPTAITWYSPPAQVEVQRDPTVSIASSNRCHTKNKFRIRPSTANGQVASMKLYVDGKKVASSTGTSEAFTINGRKYGPGSHSIKLVTTFTSGKVVTTTKTFNRCKARTVVKRRAPRFTG